MAFQQPIQRPARRAATPPPIATTLHSSRKSAPIEESQEWVLFSPAPTREDQGYQDASPATQTPTPATLRTAPKSRLSDFGSLDTAAVSERHRDNVLVEIEQEEDDHDDDDADSLDDGLHAFNEPASASIPSAHYCLDSSIAEPLLPAHDGLGAFTGSSQPIQQQLWQHERYNPQRIARRSSSLRRSSVQRRLDRLNEEHQKEASKDPAEERNRRIEKWRLEQSRAIVEEIERETRRQRRKSKLSQSQLPPCTTNLDESKENIAPEVIVVDDAQCQSTESIGFWSRARRMIQDIIGVDDTTLSYIFGESVPPVDGASHTSTRDVPTSPSQMIKLAESTMPDNLDIVRASNSWEENLLARLARELGALMHHFSEHPTGAFSTYLKVQETVPYAGLPNPSEITTPAGFFRFDSTPAAAPTRQPNPRYRHRRRLSAARTDPSLFGITEEPPVDNQGDYYNDLARRQTRVAAPIFKDESKGIQREREYWEKDLDVKMVFGFLKNRLGRSQNHKMPTSDPRTSSAHTSNSPFSTTMASSGVDALRRAALIRHHHPLVSRNLSNLRASSQTQVSQSSHLPMAPLSPILGRRNSSVIDDGASSCASQSTKKSKTHHSASFSIGSSRNFWDIGGVGWGEV